MQLADRPQRDTAGPLAALPTNDLLQLRKSIPCACDIGWKVDVTEAGWGRGSEPKSCLDAGGRATLLTLADTQMKVTEAGYDSMRTQ